MRIPIMYYDPSVNASQFAVVPLVKILSKDDKGIEEILKKIDTANESDYQAWVYAVIASLGIDKYLDRFVHSKYPIVRMAVAEVGRDKDLGELVNDDDSNVLAEVAKHGRDKDFEKLKHSNNISVLTAFLKSKNEKFIDFFLSDEMIHNHDFSMINYFPLYEKIAAFNRKQDFKKLLSLHDDDVDIALAKNGNKEEQKIIAKNTNSFMVAKYLVDLNDQDIMNILAHNTSNDDIKILIISHHCDSTILEYFMKNSSQPVRVTIAMRLVEDLKVRSQIDQKDISKLMNSLVE